MKGGAFLIVWFQQIIDIDCNNIYNREVVKKRSFYGQADRKGFCPI